MSAENGSIQHRGALSLLLFASTLGVMGGAIIFPVLELIRRDLDVSGTAAGLIITTHGLTIAVTSPITGWLIDRLGARHMLGVGLILYGVAGGTGLVVSSYHALIASRVFFGAGAAVVFTATTVAMLAPYRGPERDRVMGWRTTATSLGGVVWPLIAGALGGLSWHGPFGLYLMGIPIGIAAFVLLPEAGDEQGKASGSVLGLLRERPRLLGVYGLMFLMFVMMYSLAVFLPQRLGEIGVEEPFLVSLIFAPAAGVASLVGLVYARIRAHAGHLNLLRWSALCWIGAFLVLGTVSHPAPLVIAPILFGIGNGLTFPTLSVLIAEYAPASLWGRANAFAATSVFVGQFMSPILLGPVIDATSITTGFLVVAGISALILVALLAAPRMTSARSEPDPVEATPR